MDYQSEVLPLKTGAIPLVHGLDLRSARSLAEPGKLLECHNYEIVDSSGLKSTDGFRPFNNGYDITEEELYVISSSNKTGTHTSGYTDSGALLINAARSTEPPFGVLVGGYRYTVSATLYYALVYLRINPEFEPGEDDGVLMTTASGGLLTLNSNPNVPVKFSDANHTQDVGQYLDSNITSNFNSPSNMVRVWNNAWSMLADPLKSPSKPLFNFDTEQLDWGTTITGQKVNGLHYFGDKLFAIADSHTTSFTDNPLAEVKPGDILFGTIGGTSEGKYGMVTGVSLTSGTWGSGSATATVSYLDVTPVESGLYGLAKFKSGFLKNSLVTCQRTGEEYATEPSELARAITTTLYRGLYGEHLGISTTRPGKEVFVRSITITAAGSGYDTPPAVIISGGGGRGATGYAVLDGGAVAAVVLTNGGSGYTSAPSVAFTTATGDVGVTAATATAQLSSYVDCGLQQWNTGWLVDFTDGNSASGYLAKIDRKAKFNNQVTTFTSTSTDIATGTNGTPNNIISTVNFEGAHTFPIGGWVAEASGPAYNNVLAATNVQATADSLWLSLFVDPAFMNNTAYYPTVGFTNFKTVGSVPVNSVITGVEVKVTYDTSGNFGTTSTTNIPLLRARSALFTYSDDHPESRTEVRIGNIKEQPITPFSSNQADTVVTFGGNNDLWGATTLRWEDVLNPNFGASFDLAVTRDSAYSFTAFRFQIDKVTIKIYYNTPSVSYFFASGKVGSKNVIQADLVDYTVSSGDFKSKDAAGVMQIANLQQFESKLSDISYTIESGWTMYADSALTTAVATISSTMQYNCGATSAECSEKESRYQAISANFYATDGWDSTYWATGAGRAFEFDGYYLAKIYTIPPSVPSSVDKDLPRHVEKFNGRLCLLNKAGELALSAANGRPRNFRGQDGAILIGLEDRGTGLAALKGEYLAAFGENTITAILSPNYQKRALSAKTGAIEYTVANIGDQIMFCTPTGITSLNETDKYGDFEGVRMSHDISSWYKPRATAKPRSTLVRLSSMYENESVILGGIVEAYPVRSKNQYRVWFRDGSILILTLVGPEMSPQFSIVKYDLPAPTEFGMQSAGRAAWPRALCSEVDLYGKERVLFSCDEGTVASFNSENGLSQSDIQGLTSGIYLADACWGFCHYKFTDFDFALIPPVCYATTTHHFFDNPFQTHTIRSVRVEGQSRNIAHCRVSLSKNYDNTTQSTEQSINIAYPNATGLPETQRAYSDLAVVQETDRNICIRIAHSGTDSDPTISLVEPPHYLQLLLVRSEEGGRDDA